MQNQLETVDNDYYSTKGKNKQQDFSNKDSGQNSLNLSARNNQSEAYGLKSVRVAEVEEDTRVSQRTQRKSKRG